MARSWANRGFPPSPKRTTINVRSADLPAVVEFVATVRSLRDYCLDYDEAEGNHGDVERIGEQLDEALEALARSIGGKRA